MARMRDFERWLNEHTDLSNFRGSEFIIRSTVAGVTNTVPPEYLWINVLPLARLLDQLRNDVGFPIVITSGYRSLEYNAVVGGAKNSQHVQFKAADIVCNHVPPSDIYQKLMKMRKKSVFAGGLAKYSTFVHVDVRGSNVNWRTRT